MAVNEINWPEVLSTLAGVGADAFEASQPWREVSAGVWESDPFTDPGGGATMVLVGAVATLEDGSRPAALVQAVSASSGAPRLRQTAYRLHGLLADAMTEQDLTVICAAEGCGEVWPCPRRESWAFLGTVGDGGDHAPTGRAS